MPNSLDYSFIAKFFKLLNFHYSMTIWGHKHHHHRYYHHENMPSCFLIEVIGIATYRFKQLHILTNLQDAKYLYNYRITYLIVKRKKCCRTRFILFVFNSRIQSQYPKKIYSVVGTEKSQPNNIDFAILHVSFCSKQRRPMQYNFFFFYFFSRVS